jgi:hypothetical protein
MPNTKTRKQVLLALASLPVDKRRRIAGWEVQRRGLYLPYFPPGVNRLKSIGTATGTQENDELSGVTPQLNTAGHREVPPERDIEGHPPASGAAADAQ